MHGHDFRRRVAITAAFALVVLAGCSGPRSDTDLATAWAPSSGNEVRGVPMASVVTAIEAQLGARPESVPADRWKHVQRLYTTYGTPRCGSRNRAFTKPAARRCWVRYSMPTPMRSASMRIDLASS